MSDVGWKQIWNRARRALFLMSVLSLFVSANALADDSCQIKLNSSILNTTRPTILEAVHFEYMLEYAEQCQFRIKLIENEHVSCTKADVSLQPTREKSILKSRVNLDCYYSQPGVFFIPPVYFEVHTGDANTPTSKYYPKFEPINIDARQSSSHLDSFVHLQRWEQNRGFIWLVFLVIGGIMLIVTIIIYHRTNTGTIRDSIQPPLNPMEVFLADIAILMEMTPMNLTEYKIYHDHLSSSFRLLLSQLFEIDAFSLTTNQIVVVLQEVGVPQELCDETRRILYESDLVKFAQEEPSQSATIFLLRDIGSLASRLSEAASDLLAIYENGGYPVSNPLKPDMGSPSGATSLDKE